MTDQQHYRFDQRIKLDLTRPSSASLGLHACSHDDSRPVRASSDFMQALAVACDATRSRNLGLARLWVEVQNGGWRFLDTFSTEKRNYAVIEQVYSPPRRPIKGRHLQIFERVLLGESPKVVAIDLRVSPSTVASAMQGCLRAIGLNCRGSSVPVLLTMAAHAALRPRCASVFARLSELDANERKSWVISARRPDLDFPVQLSGAEMAVLRQLVAGNTHAQISSQRATSRRTVANQLATAFRKLGVSGRGEVVGHLITHSLQLAPLSESSLS
jgi:DNA-binding NarL/FixJ family response regulator